MAWRRSGKTCGPLTACTSPITTSARIHRTLRVTPYYMQITLGWMQNLFQTSRSSAEAVSQAHPNQLAVSYSTRVTEVTFVIVRGIQP